MMIDWEQVREVRALIRRLRKLGIKPKGYDLDQRKRKSEGNIDGQASGRL